MTDPGEFYIGGPSIILNTPIEPGEFERVLFHEIYHFSQLIGSSFGSTLLYANRIFHNSVNEYIAYIVENKLCSGNSPIEDILPDRMKGHVANIHKIEILTFKQKIYRINKLRDLLLSESRDPIDRYTPSIRFFLESLEMDEETIHSFICRLEDLPDERVDSYLYVGENIGQELSKWGVDLIDNETAILVSPKMVVENFASFFSFFYDKVYETAKFGSDLAPFDLYDQYPAKNVALNLALMELFQGKGNQEEILCSIFGLYELSLMTDFHPAIINLLRDDRTSGKYFDSFSVSKRFLAILRHMLSNGLITGAENPITHNYTADLDGICSRLQWVKYSQTLSLIKSVLTIPGKSIFQNRFSDSNRHLFQWALHYKTEKTIIPVHWSEVVNELSSASIPIVVLRDDRDFIIYNKDTVFPKIGDSSHNKKWKELFVKSAARKSFYTTFWEMFCRDLADGNGFKETKKFFKNEEVTVSDLIDYQFDLARSIDLAEQAHTFQH